MPIDCLLASEGLLLGPLEHVGDALLECVDIQLRHCFLTVTHTLLESLALNQIPRARAVSQILYKLISSKHILCGVLVSFVDLVIRVGFGPMLHS